MSVARVQTKLMGNMFDFAVIANSEKIGKEQIQTGIDEIRRIEEVFTTFSDNSMTNKVNEMAGIEAVEVSDEFFNLVTRAQRISDLTEGYFDLSYGSVDRDFWNFNRSMKKLPDKMVAKNSVALVNYKNIVLNPDDRTIFLRKKGMRIGFGGIGKGYAADRAKKVMMDAGVENGIVNASGDLNAWGYQEDGSPWTIGIANPNLRNSYFSALNVTNKSIATSGNYEKFVIIDDQLYSHTINPRTGYPIHGIKSVTVITSNAELADAMATPISIMGVSEGLDFINQMRGIECIMVNDANKLYVSNNINLIK